MAIAIFPLDPAADHPVLRTAAVCPRPEGDYVLGLGVRDEATGDQRQLTVRTDVAHFNLIASAMHYELSGEAQQWRRRVGGATNRPCHRKVKCEHVPRFAEGMPGASP